MRLTNNSSDSRTIASNGWSVASSGSNVHIVWQDNRIGGSYKVFYKNSTNSGINWGNDIQLTNNVNFSVSPSIAVSGSVVHIVWNDYRDGNNEIYYKRSTDSGVNWETDVRLTNNITSSVFPSIAVNGSFVHVVWHGANIQYIRSTNSGVSWGPVMQLTNSPLAAVGASIAVSGSDVHLAWMDNRDGNWEIYYKSSSDGGLNWGIDTRLTNNNVYSGYCSIAVFGSVVHLVWVENRVFYKRSTNGGLNWEANIQLTDSSYSEEPSIAVSGSIVHVVWTDWRDGSEIYYKRSPDSGLNWETEMRLTNNTSNSQYPSVAVFGSNVHVAWTDNRDGNKEIYYKRNPTGNTIGIKNISSEIPSSYSLEQNYPNPFNPITKIKFDIPAKTVGQTFLSVYDILGKEIATLVNEQLAPGTYEVTFDASMLTSGIYFYRLTAGDFSETKKMLLLK